LNFKTNFCWARAEEQKMAREKAITVNSKKILPAFFIKTSFDLFATRKFEGQ
jgi:hypothetical protein